MYPKKIYGLLILALAIWACEDILEVPDISEQQITILAPLDGSNINDNAVNFNWDRLVDIDNYHIQVATPDFDNASQMVLDSLFARDSLGFIATRIQLPLLNGAYEWRVKGVNSGYETPFATSAFMVNGDANADIVPPNTPVLVSPEDGTTQDETAVQFSWTREAVSGSAERDSIYIYTDENLQTLETKGLGANGTFDADLTSNTYYWFVRAFDDAGNESDASDTFQLGIN